MKALMNTQGFTFRTVKQAVDFYGDRFNSMINNGLLIEVIIDKDGNIID